MLKNRVQPPGDFPNDYFPLLEAILSGKQSLMPFDSEAEAKSFKRDFRNFVRGFMHFPRQYPELSRKVMETKFTLLVDDGGNGQFYVAVGARVGRNNLLDIAQRALDEFPKN